MVGRPPPKLPTNTVGSTTSSSRVWTYVANLLGIGTSLTLSEPMPKYEP